jgi:hypothetical protein
LVFWHRHSVAAPIHLHAASEKRPPEEIKMPNRKKILFVAAVCALPFFTGCSGKATIDKGNTVPASQLPAAPTDAMMRQGPPLPTNMPPDQAAAAMAAKQRVLQSQLDTAHAMSARAGGSGH